MAQIIPKIEMPVGMAPAKNAVQKELLFLGTGPASVEKR